MSHTSDSIRDDATGAVVNGRLPVDPKFLGRRPALALAFAQVALLAACGGGGGSSTPPPPPPPPPTLPPTQTDINDAQTAKLNALGKIADSSLTLQWLDTFPEGTNYNIETRDPDGSYTTIGSVPGEGGQSTPMSWAGSLVAGAIVRIEANDHQHVIALLTVSGGNAISEVEPLRVPGIVVDQVPPLTGMAHLSLDDRLPYKTVNWYAGQASLGTATGPGAFLSWETDAGADGTYALEADIVTAPDFLLRLAPVDVTVTNNGVDIATTLWSDSGKSYVDVQMHPGTALQVAATLDAGSQVVLQAPNSCGPPPCANPDQLVYYEFSYDEMARPGAHIATIQVTNSSGVSQQLRQRLDFDAAQFTPADGVFVYGTLHLHGTANGTGSEVVDAFFDDTQILSGASSPFSVDYDVTNVTPGPHVLTVEAGNYDTGKSPQTRTIVVASSPDLVYTPVASLGVGQSILAIQGDLVVYTAPGLVHARNMVTGTDVALAGSTSIANAQRWQTDGGFVYVQGGGAGCAMTCIYQWAPDGTLTNLTPDDGSGSTYDEVSAGFGAVAWTNESTPDEPYTVYDVATGTYTRIAQQVQYYSPWGAAVPGLYGGSLHVYFWQLQWFHAVYDWSQVTGQSTLVGEVGEGPNLFDLHTDGLRVTGCMVSGDDLFGYDLADGSQVGTGGGLSGCDSASASNGVTAWHSADGIGRRVSVLDAQGLLTPAAAYASQLYGTANGIVAYGNGHDLYTWDSTTLTSTLRADVLPNQAFLTSTALYFTVGGSNALYRVPMP